MLNYLDSYTYIHILVLMEKWDTPSLDVNAQNQGVKGKTRAKG